MNKFIIFISVFLLLLVLVRWSDRFKSERFDSKAWIAGDANVRGRMVGDLYERKLLSGKKYDEVRSMLGTPDGPEDYVWVWKVYIGETFGGMPWAYYLNVYFNTNAQVVTNVMIVD